MGSVAGSRIYRDQVLIIFLSITSANKISNCNMNKYILKQNTVEYQYNEILGTSEINLL